jgi:hypothetical protein
MPIGNYFTRLEQGNLSGNPLMCQAGLFVAFMLRALIPTCRMESK